MRPDQRKPDQLRNVQIDTPVNRYAEGSALIQFGHTKVLCTATIEPNVPKWLQHQGRGWISAEYGMLPRSTHDRMNRERTFSSGRTQEISRLLARSLRSCVDLYKLGERSIMIDCDVIQADGGTRTAAITGGFVALTQALVYLKNKEPQLEFPLKNFVSAISVGLIDGEPHLDLCYQEDSSAETDANFVINSDGGFIEIQGTAEDKSFSPEQLQKMIGMAQKGCGELIEIQKKTLESLNLSQWMKS